jgi:hypothetical protein
MRPIVYVPEVPNLECGPNGQISFRQMEDYFVGIAKIISQLKLQAKFIQDECGKELIEAIRDMEKLVDDITGILMTDVFKKIKSKEQEMKYKVREFLKEIDVWFQKRIVDALLKIVDILGIPNPLTTPIPFITAVTLVDEAGNPVRYQPVINDLFTKEGKVKIKAAIAEDIESVRKFFGDGKYDGTLGIKSPEHEAEEFWQKALAWMKELLSDFIAACINALIGLLTKIPIIGPIIEKIGVFIDPTKPIKAQLKLKYEDFKKRIKKAKEDVLSGKAIEDFGEKLLQELIDFVLNLPIPLFGTLGNLIGFDNEERKKKETIHSKEELWHRIEDAFEDAMEKIKKFFQTDLIAKIHDIILKAPGWILQQFPIVGKILDTIKLIIDICRGKVSICQVLNIILKPIFGIPDAILKFIPNCIEIRRTKYGLEPNPDNLPKWAQPASATV